MERPRLHPDLLREVFAQLYDNNPSNLLPVTLVSRQSYLLAIPFIYRSITIDVSANEWYRRCTEDSSQTLLKRLLAKPLVRGFVRDVRVINRSDFWGDDSDELSEVLASLLPKFNRLVTFRWETSDRFPEFLLYPLHQLWSRSNFQMEIRIRSDICGAFEVCCELLSHALETLRSFHIQLPEGSSSRRQITSMLSTALRDWPALRKFVIYAEHEGDYERQNQPWLSLNVKPGDRLPRLSELWTTNKTMRSEDLERWGEEDGWSQLEKVTVSDQSLLASIKGCEKTLASLTVTKASDGIDESLLTFCSHNDGLDELRICGKSLGSPIKTLEKHGHSLKTFALRCYYGNPVKVEELRCLDDWCPKLSSLEVDIGRCPQALTDLATFPEFSQLVNLTLFSGHVQKFVRSLDKCQRRSAGMANTEKMFLHLTERRTIQQLKSIKVHYDTHISGWDCPNGRHSTYQGEIFHAMDIATKGQVRRIEVKQLSGRIPAWERSELPDTIIGDLAEKQTREFLDAMPPAILSRLLLAYNDRSQTGPKDTKAAHAYEIQTCGSDTKIAEYERDWEASNPILPLLEWQLRKRQDRGWKLWEMPLMQAEAGTEGFLYDRLRAGVS